MAKAFDFQLTADDRVSESIQSIDDAVKKLIPQLNNARTGLQLGGRQSSEGVDEISGRLGNLAKNARDGVQFIGDLVPPLKMVGGLTLGLGGLATAVNAVKSGIQDYANSGYKIDTTSKNISTTTRAYQELTGAMIENGSARDAAEGSVSGLYQRANDALNMRDDGFLALMSQLGIKISKTKEGVADVTKLMDDLNKAMLEQSPARQAVIAQVGGFSPELLSFLRQSTEQVKRLKEQAQRDGLIFSDKDVQNALAFRNQVNQISASWDGMLMKSQAWLGQAPIVKKSFDDASQIMQHGMDAPTFGSLLMWNSGGNQADQLRSAEQDEKFKDTLSFKEKMDLRLGYASEDLQKKLKSYYGPVDAAKQLQQDVKGLYVQPPYSVPPASYNQSGNGNARGIRNNNPGNLRVAPNAVGNLAAIESELKGVGAPLRFSNLSILGSADAGLAYLHFGYLDWIAKQSVPWSATDENLAGWAALKSVTQKSAHAGTNSVAVFTGSSGKTVPAGTVLNRGDGYQYTTNAEVTVGSGSTGIGAITAVLPDPNDDPTGGGAAGNTPAGTQLSLDTSISGVDSVVTLGTAITDGADIESEDAFRTRMLLAYQNTPQGGNDDDYESWALAVSGVTRAWTSRRLMGAGTVGVYIMIDGTDTSNNGFPVGTDGISQLENWSAVKATGDQGRVADYIYPLQPVTALVYVCSPIRKTVNFVIDGISTADSATTAAINAAIDLVFFESGDPTGGKVLLSDLVIALSNVSGTSGFILTSPTANIITATGEIPVRGTVTYT